MSQLDRDIYDRELNADSLSNHFELDSFSDDELSDLEYAIHKIQTSRRNKEKANVVSELKKRYEGKWFNIENCAEPGIYFIKTIEDRYWCTGIYFTNTLGRLQAGTGWKYVRGRIHGLFTPSFALSGKKTADAPIDSAIELSQWEVNDWLEKWFEQTQQELIYGICNKQQD